MPKKDGRFSGTYLKTNQKANLLKIPTSTNQKTLVFDIAVYIRPYKPISVAPRNPAKTRLSILKHIKNQVFRYIAPNIPKPFCCCLWGLSSALGTSTKVLVCCAARRIALGCGCCCGTGTAPEAVRSRRLCSRFLKRKGSQM